MKYKIFISGAQKELKVERRAIKDYILGDALFLNISMFFYLRMLLLKANRLKSLILKRLKNAIFTLVFLATNTVYRKKQKSHRLKQNLKKRERNIRSF